MNIVESQNNFILHLSKEEMNALVRAIDEVSKIFSDNAFITIINYNKKELELFSTTRKQQAFVSSSTVTGSKINVSCTLRELGCLQNILAIITSKIDKRKIEKIVGIQVNHLEEIFCQLKSFNKKHEQDIFVYQPQIHQKDICREPEIAAKSRKLCELYTDLYEIKLYLQKLSNSQGDIGIIVTLRTMLQPYKMVGKTSAKAISLSQLERLRDDLSVVFSKQSSSNAPIPLFLELKEIFQIIINKNEDVLDNANFVLLELIINLGESSPKYLKVESLVAVSEIKKFSESIHDAVQVLR